MRVRVLLFGPLAERAGRSETELEVADGQRVEDLASALRARFPGLGEALDTAAWAVNREYVPSAHPLADGDEVALIPPVSGG